MRNFILRNIKRYMLKTYNDYEFDSECSCYDDIIFVDVGCRNALQPEIMERIGYYLGIDADLNEIKTLSEHFNHLDNVKFVHEFVSNSKESAYYYMHPNGNFNGSEKKSADKLLMQPKSLEQILLSNDFKGQKNGVKILDIDTEGTALDILLSISDLKQFDMISLEIFVNMNNKNYLADLSKIMGLMSENNFRMLSLARVNRKKTYICADGVDFMDCVFVQEDVFQKLQNGYIPEWLQSLMNIKPQQGKRGISYYLGELLIRLGISLKRARGGTRSDRNYPI